MAELSIRVLARKRPIDALPLGVASAFPGVDLAARRFSVHQSPSGALSLQDADLDLRHVQPIGMLGRVVKLAAFVRRWRSGGEGKLLLLGKTGWKVDDLLRRIWQSTEFGIRLIVVNDASDAEIAKGLQKRYACVQASEVEGFGLPIYFSLSNSANLIHAIDELARRYPYVRARVAEYRWLTWQDAADSLFRRIVAMHQRVSAAVTGSTASVLATDESSAS